MKEALYFLLLEEGTVFSLCEENTAGPIYVFTVKKAVFSLYGEIIVFCLLSDT